VADLPPLGVPGTPGAGRAGGSRGRHAQTRKPEPGWVPTAERFRDPSSGVIMRVWIDPADESRHYVYRTTPLHLDELVAWQDGRRDVESARC
jgi:hypothetical protein